MTLTPAERLDALAARGVTLYLAPSGELRARCEPCFARYLDAALPAIRFHKSGIVAELVALRSKSDALRTASPRKPDAVL